ncbi:hypothetical protein [Streptomyces albogriseolus]|uniref:hypothetical protein n=1 Tax=Streptomyces albogriseolus TaxID=1887 RepID=UPI00346025AB
MTCVILARDFNSDTTDPHRDRWSGAAMSAVVRALNGKKVAITTKTDTGHTLTGVTLSHVSYVRQPCVTVVDDANPAGIAYPLWQVGMVLPLEDGMHSTKWDAIELFRKEQSEAARVALDWAEERRGARTWGSVKMRPLDVRGLFDVEYTPLERPAEGRVPGSRFVVRVQVTDGEGRVTQVVTDETERDRVRAERERVRAEVRQYRDRGEKPPAELVERLRGLRTGGPRGAAVR